MKKKTTSSTHKPKKVQKGGGQAEREAVAKQYGDQAWNMIVPYMGSVPAETQTKINDLIHRGAYDWLGDN